MRVACSVEGCDEPHLASGLCSKHWQRRKRLGGLNLPTLAEKFWRRVNKDGPVHPACGQCWAWTGAEMSGGYGRMGAGAKGNYISAHRFSWKLHFGAIPESLCVLHRCDNRLCVNPAHLFLGTKGDNNSDRHEKGRDTNQKGEDRPMAKLTDEAVRKIRERYRPRDSANGNAALAHEFGVSPAVISDVVNGKRWKHVT